MLFWLVGLSSREMMERENDEEGVMTNDKCKNAVRDDYQAKPSSILSTLEETQCERKTEK